MRKEVYTRKAKKAFSKLKQKYGDQTSLPKSNIKFEQSKSISYQKHSYRPFFESKTYRIIKVIALVAVAMLLVWHFWIQERYFQYRRDQFQTTGFRQLYQSELQHFDTTFEYAASMDDKIISIKYTKWHSKLFLNQLFDFIWDQIINRFMNLLSRKAI